MKNKLLFNDGLSLLFTILLFILFRLCIVTETWPQPDIYGWIQNTTITNNAGVGSGLMPAICLCYYPGFELFLLIMRVLNKE
jgi:hypothetical protein